MTLRAGKSAVLLLLAVMLLLAAGCGGASGNSGGQIRSEANLADEPPTGGQTDWLAEAEAADVADLPTGVDDMSGLVKSFKTFVEDGNEELAKQTAQQLAAVWKAIRADAEAAGAGRREQIERDIGLLMETMAGKEPNQTLLVDLAYSLFQAIREMKQSIQ